MASEYFTSCKVVNNFAQSSLANKWTILSAFHRLDKIFPIIAADRATMAGSSTAATGSLISVPTGPSNPTYVERSKVLHKLLSL